MSDNLELPLKVPNETFTDEPEEINDVNIHDLVIDIETKVKFINELHILQAVAIMWYSLEDMIKLRENPELFNKFREQQLSKRNIDLNLIKLNINIKIPDNKFDLNNSSSNESNNDNNDNDTVNNNSNNISNNNSNNNINIINNNDIRKTTPPNSPPAKMLKVETEFALKETTPDSLIAENDFLTIEELIENTDIEKVNKIDFDDIREEVNYYQDKKIINQTEHVIKHFNLIKPPNLTIEQYLKRIQTYSPSTSVSCYIHACLLIYKLSVLHNVLPLTLCNVYRVILALIRCLTKKLEDIYQKQKTFATVGGVTLDELFKIEVGFLFLCNFKLIVGEDSLNNYLMDFTDLRNFVREHIDNGP